MNQSSENLRPNKTVLYNKSRQLIEEGSFFVSNTATHLFGGQFLFLLTLVPPPQEAEHCDQAAQA